MDVSVANVDRTGEAMQPRSGVEMVTREGNLCWAAVTLVAAMDTYPARVFSR
jgi:hypothetical protein